MSECAQQSPKILAGQPALTWHFHLAFYGWISAGATYLTFRYVLDELGDFSLYARIGFAIIAMLWTRYLVALVLAYAQDRLARATVIELHQDFLRIRRPFRRPLELRLEEIDTVAEKEAWIRVEAQTTHGRRRAALHRANFPSLPALLPHFDPVL